MAGGFFAAIAVTSPYMLRDAAYIVRRLAKASDVNREGFMFFAGSNFTEWLAILFNPSFLGGAGLIGLALVAVAFVRRHDWPQLTTAERALFVIHGAWATLFCLYLFVTVNVRLERYLLPMVPSFALITGFVCARTAGVLLRTTPAKILAAAAFLVILAPNVVMTAKMVDAHRHRTDTSRVKAGIWLQEHVPATAVIASDYLTYVPETFPRQLRQSFLTSRDVMLANPDFIVINKESVACFRDIGKAKTFTEGEGAYMLHYLLYHGLATGEFPGYARLREFDEVIVYGRKYLSADSAGL
jgi:hypothetical protein